MLREIEARLVRREEQPRFQQLMQAHHYLGALPKIGETLWYVASYREEWVALLSFSAAALKIAARDRWIGWSYRQQYARLKLLANNTRFCVLPPWQRPNVASRTLALCERRLAQDWSAAFGHPILLLETFVDGQRHRGTLYQAANWSHVGDTRGYRRIPGGYSATVQSPKKIFVRPLHPRARSLLCQASLETVEGASGAAKFMLTAGAPQHPPPFVPDIPDHRPRRGPLRGPSRRRSGRGGSGLGGLRDRRGPPADRHGRRRMFPFAAPFLLEGSPVRLTRPAPRATDGTAPRATDGTAPRATDGTAPRATAGAGAGMRRTASGSIAAPTARARVARASRIYVEGRHDAELVEKIWGDDLRDVGVVVEYLGGIDDLPAIVEQFRPEPGRRLGVLVDHLVTGSKESRIAALVRSEHVLIVGHPFIDVWAGVKPSVLGIGRWPDIPPGTPWKEGVLAAIGWPTDTATGWRRILGAVSSFTDLEPSFLGRVEELIDFVTAPGSA